MYCWHLPWSNLQKSGVVAKAPRNRPCLGDGKFAVLPEAIRCADWLSWAGVAAIRTINLKSGMPLVHEALQHLQRELALARKEQISVLKLVHGYGSTGAGGEIRLAVQNRLLQMVESGEIRSCVFGENWSKSDDLSWKVLQSHPELKTDRDLGRGNRGVTIVLF